MKLNKYILLIGALGLALQSYSQEGTIKRAAKDYDKFSYVKTSEVLLTVANEGYKSVDLFQKLGNSFYFNNKMEEASKWYGELMMLNEDVDLEYYYRYAQTLKSIKNYSEADKWMQKFASIKSDDLRAKSFTSKLDYLSSIENVSENFAVENMDINTEYSDFGSNQYKNKLVFSSSRELTEKLYKWNEQPYLELFTATRQNDGSYANVEKFDDVINTKYHESTASFLPNDRIVYFTRNNYYRKRLKRDGTGINRLQLYRAIFQKNGSWGGVKSVHFNSINYSVAHPSVNAKGDKLYFASDMPGTQGKSDIYVVGINEDGTLGVPKNLGMIINTEDQETFPYINSKGDLYYSSNGLNGLGGLDIYMIRDFEEKFSSNQPLTVENVGKPINSSKDDFGYYENLGTKEGFFTSNRDGGKGDDDIYSFKIPDCLQNIDGFVFDKKTKDLITGATVRLYEESDKEVSSMIIGVDGKYMFSDLRCEKEYLVRVEKENYSTDEDRIVTTDIRNQTVSLDLEIELETIPLTKGTNLREAINLNPIYFDLDKFNIRIDAEIELQKIIAILKQYPNIKIYIKSHTDSRATKAYNDILSSKRNVSIIKYLVNIGGIDTNRLTGKGYGERQLSNKCANDVKCLEEEHQQNRRSDFIIVEN